MMKLFAGILCAMLVLTSLNACLAGEMPEVGGQDLKKCVERLPGFTLEEDDMSGNYAIMITPADAKERYEVDGYSFQLMIDGSDMLTADTALFTCILSFSAPEDVREIGHLIFLTDGNRYVLEPNNSESGSWTIKDQAVGFLIFDDVWAMFDDIASSSEVKVRFGKGPFSAVGDESYADITMSPEMQYMFAQIAHIYHTYFEEKVQKNSLVQMLLMTQMGYKLQVGAR